MRARGDGNTLILLSEQGAAPDKTLRADEALPMFAVSVGASLVRTDERIAPADGTDRRWRRDLNPRTVLAVSRFQGECIRPLCHATAAKGNRH